VCFTESHFRPRVAQLVRRCLLTLDYPPSGCARPIRGKHLHDARPHHLGDRRRITFTHTQEMAHKAIRNGGCNLIHDAGSRYVSFQSPGSKSSAMTDAWDLGGGIMASGTIEAVHTGEKIIIAGLVVQLLFFGFFIITGVIFHARLVQQPTAKVYSQSLPWERQLYSLYIASLLILVRCIFRLIEYAQGNDGYLISHEVFLYVFDAVLMFATMVWMAWVHPSEITALLSKGRGRAVRRAISVYSLR
jgi:hypothetical protein